MSAFEFMISGSAQRMRVEVNAENATELAKQISTERFIVGEVGPDEWGELRRVIIPSARINIVFEAE